MKSKDFRKLVDRILEANNVRRITNLSINVANNEIDDISAI